MGSHARSGPSWLISRSPATPIFSRKVIGNFWAKNSEKWPKVLVSNGMFVSPFAGSCFQRRDVVYQEMALSTSCSLPVTLLCWNIPKEKRKASNRKSGGLVASMNRLSKEVENASGKWMQMLNIRYHLFCQMNRWNKKDRPLWEWNTWVVQTMDAFYGFSMSIRSKNSWEPSWKVPPYIRG